MDERKWAARAMKTWMKPPLFIAAIFFSFFGILFTLTALLIASTPKVNQLKSCMTTYMYRIKVCPGSSDYVPFSHIPQHLIDALLISEDANFYNHSGFDWNELKISFRTNIQNLSYKRGGSTLTQQLAKNAFLSADKSLLRKIREAYLTYRIEQNFSKREILEKYLNMVEFGAGLYGVGPAARFYFHKSVGDLHMLQSIFLVMLLPNPKVYSQSFRKGRLTPFARQRILLIASRMQRFRRISEAEHIYLKENIDSFPWSHLNEEDFQFSLPDLPEDITDSLPENENSSLNLEEEIRQQAEEGLEEEELLREDDFQ